jgi:3-hydroxybutyrate dehydrogenase
MILPERVALVTGGGTGIGLAIARAFLDQGAQVIIASRNKAHLDAAANTVHGAGHALATHQLDVTDQEAVRAAMESIARQYGRVDILVNNAGLSGRTPINDADASQWRAILATNLDGSYFCCREVLRFMPDGQHGRIINMSSVLGRFGVPGYAAYCTAKHGILGFTKALALEVAPRGITVNAICPTWVDTAMARQGIEETAAVIGITPEEFRKQAVRAIPIGRMVEASEVAALAVFLASPKAAGITGEAINIAGGATAGAG